MKPTYIFAFAYRGKPYLDKFETFTTQKDLITKLQWYQKHGTKDQRFSLSEYAHSGFIALEISTTPEGTTSRSIKKEIKTHIQKEDFQELLKLTK